MARASLFSAKTLFGCLTCVGVVLFLFSLIFGLAVRAKIHSTIASKAPICGKESDNYAKWSTNTAADDPPKRKLFYGFNSTNAAAYLSQTMSPVKLQLEMLGPYSMRQYDTFYDVEFTPDNSQVSYKTYSRFEFERDQSCDTCDNTDRYTGLNPGLLKLMTRAGSELIIGLSVSSYDVSYTGNPCTSANIQYSLSRVCNTSDTTDTSCCCNSTVDATNPYSCLVRASGLYSTFAGYDGGVPFISPILRKPVVSPLFVTKNIHEFAYGYPSSLLGLIFASLAPATVPSMAMFSQMVLQACNFAADGVAPSVDSLAGKPYQYLGLITCAPVNGMLHWAVPLPNFGGLRRCDLVNMALKSKDACQCVVPSHGEGGESTAAKPCCTRKGLGCLYKMPGYISESLYLSQDQAAANAGIDRTVQNTGCGSYPDGQDYWWTTYKNQSSWPAWAQFSRAPNVQPSQVDVLKFTGAPSLASFSAVVQGDDGTRAVPTGVTSGVLSSQLTDGPPPKQRTVFVTQVFRPVRAELQGVEEWNGIRVARYSPYAFFLSNSTDADPPGGITNYLVGAATPYDGVQDCSFLYGFPIYVSRPLFLYGDPRLLTNGVEISYGGQRAVLSPTGDASEFLVTPDKFDTYVMTEPASGLTISGHKRLMASFSLYKCTQPQQGCDPTRSPSLANVLNPFVPAGALVPQYYMDESSGATQSQVDSLKTVLQLNRSAGVLIVVGTVLGVILAAFSGFMLYRTYKRSHVSTIEASLLEHPDESRMD